MSDIQSIVIVGGGTTGWLAACYLQRTLDAVSQRALPITLIEPSQVTSIGADMATVPTLRNTMQALGLPESTLFTAADATLTNGIRFKGWHRGDAAQGDSYDHPFDMPMPFSGFAATAHWLNLMQRGLTSQPMAEACTVQTALFDGHQSPKLMDSPDYQAPVSYGYQLDAVKLAMLLQQTAQQRGVRHVRGQVVRVHRGARGIESVELADGSHHAASFFIDCSGSQSLLLQQGLGVPWVSYADDLPCDRVVTVPLAYAEPHEALRSYTTASAQAAGWTWEMDLQSRRGTGHVYASRFCSDDEAAHTLQAVGAGQRPLAEPRLQRLRIGHAARAWEANCLALGTAAGCIEPLQSTSLYLVEWVLQLFVDHVAPSGNSDRCRGRVNRVFSDLHEELRDFIVAHYALSARRDTPFWRACTEEATLPPRLTELLALWDSKVPTPTDLDRRLSLFGVANWFYLLAGLHRLPSGGIGLAAHIAPEISLQAMAHVRGIRQQASQQSPTMREYLRSLTAGALPACAH
ncbi:MAG: tryptophan halogenase family protein [Roseateles sp.]|uniref:tryptophan halogenase family protein n=1 Tax=Roseateles sp. TaxID=1971397 RepID=UPI00403580E5